MTRTLLQKDTRPAWMKAMRLKRLVPAALAIQILMATMSSAQARVPVPHECSVSGPCAQEPVPHQPIKEPVVYGAPLGLAAMAHAPTNEGGVMFLFGVLAAQLAGVSERDRGGGVEPIHRVIR